VAFLELATMPEVPRVNVPTLPYHMSFLFFGNRPTGGAVRGATTHAPEGLGPKPTSTIPYVTFQCSKRVRTVDRVPKPISVTVPIKAATVSVANDTTEPGAIKS